MGIIDRNQSEKIPIMPLSEPSLWQEISKWLVGALSAVTLAFLGAIRWWVGDRFAKVDSRIDEVSDKAQSAMDKANEHENALTRLEVHMTHSQDDRKAIHSKLDNIHDLLLKNGSDRN